MAILMNWGRLPTMVANRVIKPACLLLSLFLSRRSGFETVQVCNRNHAKSIGRDPLLWISRALHDNRKNKC